MKKAKIAITDKNRFKELFERIKTYKSIIIPRDQWIDPEKIKEKKELIEGLGPALESVKFDSFFQPFFLNRIRDLPKFVDKKVVRKVDLLRYVKEGLFLCAGKQKLNEPATWYDAFYRLPLIITCDKVLKYPFSKTKQIVAFDNFLIDAQNQLSQGVLKGKLLFEPPVLSGPPLVFLRKYFEWLFELNGLFLGKDGILKGKVHRKDRSFLRKYKMKPELITFLEYLSHFNYEKATLKEKSFVNSVAFVIWFRYEKSRLSPLAYVHKMVSYGFSPQVVLKAAGLVAAGLKIDEPELFKEIDWGITLELTEKAQCLTFFRTPYFDVILDGKEMRSSYNAEKVDSTLMRNIDKVAIRLRKRLNPTRKPWGDKPNKTVEDVQRNKRILSSFMEKSKQAGRKRSDIFREITDEFPSLTEKSIARIIYRSLKSKS